GVATGGGWITGRSYTPEVTDGTTTTKMAECRYNSHANGGEKFTAKQRERLQCRRTCTSRVLTITLQRNIQNTIPESSTDRIPKHYTEMTF
ncbi:MAG: hypothetical protein K6T83_18355, partial [Alicyclobacillus sp.]|nr:hypothetical protein [Alicyclobacillus sp.]